MLPFLFLYLLSGMAGGLSSSKPTGGGNGGLPLRACIGEFCGELHGDTCGDDRGELLGETSGEVFGEFFGEFRGELNGELWGEDLLEVLGEANGDAWVTTSVGEVGVCTFCNWFRL